MKRKLGIYLLALTLVALGAASFSGNTVQAKPGMIQKLDR